MPECNHCSHRARRLGRAGNDVNRTLRSGPWISPRTAYQWRPFRSVLGRGARSEAAEMLSGLVIKSSERVPRHPVLLSRHANRQRSEETLVIFRFLRKVPLNRNPTISDEMRKQDGFTAGFDYLRIGLAFAVLVWHSDILSTGSADLYDARWSGPFRSSSQSFCPCSSRCRDFSSPAALRELAYTSLSRSVRCGWSQLSSSRSRSPP